MNRDKVLTWGALPTSNHYASKRRCVGIAAASGLVLKSQLYTGLRVTGSSVSPILPPFGEFQARCCGKVAKAIVHKILILGAMATCGALLALAQQSTKVAGGEGLPDAPGVAIGASAPQVANTSTPNSGAVSGTVLDQNGAEIQSAQVVLESPSGQMVRSGQSGADGEFTFTGLPAGDFKLVVSGAGWGTYTSPEIQLQAGAFRIIPNIVLPLETSAVVHVTADGEELAEEQVHVAEQQRVLGVIPNFYSSYDWNAPPMQTKQKFQLSIRALIDPMEFVAVGATAGYEQHANIFPAYGTGAEGYAKRFGAAYANNFSGEFLANAVFPSMFHQDPRYFYKGSGSVGSRMLYALSSAVVARGDDGRREPNYSYVLGSFAAGGISNLYYPQADRGAKLMLFNGLADIGGHAGADLLREFILKRVTTRAHHKLGGQP